MLKYPYHLPSIRPISAAYYSNRVPRSLHSGHVLFHTPESSRPELAPGQHTTSSTFVSVSNSTSALVRGKHSKIAYQSEYLRSAASGRSENSLCPWHTEHWFRKVSGNIGGPMGTLDGKCCRIEMRLSKASSYAAIGSLVAMFLGRPCMPGNS